MYESGRVLRGARVLDENEKDRYGHDKDAGQLG
jgi:hypothetical protein